LIKSKDGITISIPSLNLASLVKHLAALAERTNLADGGADCGWDRSSSQLSIWAASFWSRPFLVAGTGDGRFTVGLTPGCLATPTGTTHYNTDMHTYCVRTGKYMCVYLQLHPDNIL